MGNLQNMHGQDVCGVRILASSLIPMQALWEEEKRHGTYMLRSIGQWQNIYDNNNIVHFSYHIHEEPDKFKFHQDPNNYTF